MDDSNSRYDIGDLLRAGDCNDALHTLYHYLDGELTDSRRQAIRDHLDLCEPCLHAFDFEAELKVVVARSCRDQVPDQLRRKIAEAIAHECGEGTSEAGLGSV
ncbi:MAG: mycothiol system anti-sigma-R factor [Acidobacteriota bacterium]|nr:mycothiol system anti-sigma-R factor [Acidobacteriota bacterium]